MPSIKVASAQVDSALDSALGAVGVRADHHAQGGRAADARPEALRLQVLCSPAAV